MPRAKSFEHIPGFAINVLARLEAKKQVKEHLRAQAFALRMSPAREMTKAHLQAHPELYEQALPACVGNGRVPPCQRIR